MKGPFSWQNAHEKLAAYEKAQDLIERNVEDFWHGEASLLSWTKPFHTVHNGGFADAKWFLGGELNVSTNCLDRHIAQGHGERTAIVFENEAGAEEKLSFLRLWEITCSIASILHDRGIKPGYRVAIYMPLVPEAIASMLACARLGAIHTVVFGGFSKEALAERICDCEAQAVITADISTRKGQPLFLKKTVEDALLDPRCHCVKTLLYFGEKSESDGFKVCFRNQTSFPHHIKHPPGFDAEHPLFILYTSGTTGKPKGIFHCSGGYLTQVVSTTKWVFDLQSTDLYWCTADVGWITGHSYVVYGPLALGASIFLYDGALNWPDPSRIYQLIDKHGVTILYTAPTAIRMFMQAGEDCRRGFDLSALRLLGSVGEPINPEAWRWYRRVFSEERCAVIDSWWQTETGAMMIVPIEHVTSQKPGSASKPFLGIRAEVVDHHGHKTSASESGFLVVKHPWPSMARGIWGDQARFHDTYFKTIKGAYFTGDGAKVDSDGDFIISGRIDDVINVAGHRLGTAEIESALVLHQAVAEAAVVGIPDQITGQKTVAFVLLMNGATPSDALAEELKNHVKAAIGSFAKPAEIHFEHALPKTRSGKIMRRLLRQKAMGQKIESDISTLEPGSLTKTTL